MLNCFVFFVFLFCRLCNICIKLHQTNTHTHMQTYKWLMGDHETYCVPVSVSRCFARSVVFMCEVTQSPSVTKNLLWGLCLCWNRRTKTPSADSRSTHIGLSCGILCSITVKTPVDYLHREKYPHSPGRRLEILLKEHKFSDRHNWCALMWLQFTVWWLNSNQTVDDIIRAVWGWHKGEKKILLYTVWEILDITQLNVVN